MQGTSWWVCVYEFGSICLWVSEFVSDVCEFLSVCGLESVCLWVGEYACEFLSVCELVSVSSRVQKFPAWHTNKGRVKWKMLWGIYIAVYGEVNVSVEKCVEIKGDYVEK